MNVPGPRWPWESKRLGAHHYVTRRWRPDRDPRIQGAVWLVFAGTVVAAVWRLQCQAGLPARATTAGLTTLVLLWMWRAWGGRLPRD